ncbi:HesA/MoeB/ThiF family protein [Thalassotalea euphylliae]|uniref:HesA/MoeB/ThiF family protein n=1 Tax=Thalassotalea euphylliae TaxID=1655234 RepID=A0A3E0U2T2_9GAMM|nr:HesA/MoeB/ThiF family protein [Thalassotalea euphylliae]REL30515.1 HesA/MoeB/ThiF family protein [Thalassotalea euphylliae]
MLTAQEHIRYGRQIMLSQIGVQGQLALQRAKVLIVGMGGLGCPVSLYLASAGVGNLVLCDGDEIEASNLQRQVLYTPDDIGENKAEVAAQKLAQQNPLIEIEAVDEMFDSELAESYLPEVDLVIDCTDSLSARYLLNQACYDFNVPLVIGAATGFDGQTMMIDPRQSSACYQCLFPASSSSNTADNNQNCQTLGILGPVLAIVAGMQSLTAIKYLANLPVNVNQLQLFDGLSQQWQQFTLAPQASCPVCQKQ